MELVSTTALQETLGPRGADTRLGTYHIRHDVRRAISEVHILSRDLREQLSSRGRKGAGCRVCIRYLNARKTIGIEKHDAIGCEGHFFESGGGCTGCDEVVGVRDSLGACDALGRSTARAVLGCCAGEGEGGEY